MRIFIKKKKFKLRVIYLDEILNIYFFHLILNLRKFFFSKFRTILVGDYRYYLHRKIISIAKKKIFVDDGFGSLYFNKFFSKKVNNSTFFTTYPSKYNVGKIIENNFEYLKSLYNVKKKIKGAIFLLPGLSEKKVLSEELYFEWINNIKKKLKGPITIIPHRNEIDLIKRTEILNRNFHIKISDLPIELSLLKFSYLPKKIIHNYSSCAVTLNKIIGKKVKILNYQNRELEKIVDYYNKGKKRNDTILPMKNFLAKKKLKFV